MSLATKVLISAGAIMFMILVLLATVFCCKKNKTVTTEQVIVKPPSYDEVASVISVTSTKTKVPMQPLINEV